MASQMPWVPAGSGEDPCCCGGPTECCLYPWPDPSGFVGGPYYPSSDLPSSIVVTVDGVDYTLPLLGSYFYFIGSGGPGGMDLSVDAGTGSENWVVNGSAISNSIADCLIGEYFDGSETVSVADEFPDEFILTGNYDIGFGEEPINIALARISTCCWQQDLDGFLFQVCYDAALFKWVISVANDPSFGTSEKPDPQDTPVGTYPDTAVMTDLEIS